jgi:branched-subunit amino acid transport protein
VLVVGLATVAIKAAGPLLAGERALPERGGKVLDLLAPALLAALVATQAFGGDQESLVLDERGAGLLAAGLAVVMRAPLLVVVLSAAATAAGLRALA